MKISYTSTRGRQAGASKTTLAAFAVLDAQKSESIEVQRLNSEGKPVPNGTKTLQGFALPSNVTAYHVTKWAEKNKKVAKVQTFGENKVVILTTKK